MAYNIQVYAHLAGTKSKKVNVEKSVMHNYSVSKRLTAPGRLRNNDEPTQIATVKGLKSIQAYTIAYLSMCVLPQVRSGFDTRSTCDQKRALKKNTIFTKKKPLALMLLFVDPQSILWMFFATQDRNKRRVSTGPNTSH